METPLLRDPDTYPTREVLENTLGNCYSVFDDMNILIKEPQYGLVPEWNYYKDGKAWLCKVCYKKKTIFWLSVWEHSFRITFYFTDKNYRGIETLDIDQEIKQNFINAKPLGKFMPLTIIVTRQEQLSDLLKIVEYKKSLK
jgi:hypothetical protein